MNFRIKKSIYDYHTHSVLSLSVHAMKLHTVQSKTG